MGFVSPEVAAKNPSKYHPWGEPIDPNATQIVYDGRFRKKRRGTAWKAGLLGSIKETGWSNWGKESGEKESEKPMSKSDPEKVVTTIKTPSPASFRKRRNPKKKRTPITAAATAASVTPAAPEDDEMTPQRTNRTSDLKKQPSSSQMTPVSSIDEAQRESMPLLSGSTWTTTFNKAPAKTFDEDTNTARPKTKHQRQQANKDWNAEKELQSTALNLQRELKARIVTLEQERDTLQQSQASSTLQQSVLLEQQADMELQWQTEREKWQREKTALEQDLAHERERSAALQEQVQEQASEIGRLEQFEKDHLERLYKCNSPIMPPMLEEEALPRRSRSQRTTRDGNASTEAMSSSPESKQKGTNDADEEEDVAMMYDSDSSGLDENEDSLASQAGDTPKIKCTFVALPPSTASSKKRSQHAQPCSLQSVWDEEVATISKLQSSRKKTIVKAPPTKRRRSSFTKRKHTTPPSELLVAIRSTPRRRNKKLQPLTYLGQPLNLRRSPRRRQFLNVLSSPSTVDSTTTSSNSKYRVDAA